MNNIKMHTNKTLGPTTSPTRHLFFDTDNLVEWETNLEQRFYQMEKVPIHGLKQGPPGSWDARITSAYGTTLVENGLFRKWFACMPDAKHSDRDADHWVTCYAESDDGIHWRKPDLKITGQQRWPGNNLAGLPGCVMSVVYALPNAGCKYLALALHKWPEPEPDVCENVELNGPGMYLFGSDDGLCWHQITRNPIIQHGDWAILHTDPVRQRYLLYTKMASSHGLTHRRAALVIESRDGIHWEGYHGTRQWEETYVPDDYDDLIAAQRGFKIGELYGLSLQQVDALYLAVQSFFTVGLPLHSKMAQNPNGIFHLRMAFSHDAKHWRFPRGRPSLLDVGRPGEFDAGFMVCESTFVDHGDEQFLYYSGTCYPHGWSITPDFKIRTDIPVEVQRGTQLLGMAKIKRHRFASLAHTFRGRFDVEIGPKQGDELTINAYCPNGAIRVAIAEQSTPYHVQPRKGESLPGFSFDDCVPFTGDSVNAPVRFRKTRIADLPKDKYLILRFEISAGEVFGYEWGTTKA
jgi:hypothetical protein